MLWSCSNFSGRCGDSGLLSNNPTLKAVHPRNQRSQNFPSNRALTKLEIKTVNLKMWKMKSSCWLLTTFAIVAMTLTAHSASDGPLSITCEKEDLLNGSWAGPLTVTYSGGAKGEMTVTSDKVTQTFLANLTEKTGVVDGHEVTSIAIRGAVDASVSMPDPQALIKCASANIQPECWTLKFSIVYPKQPGARLQ
jgi:hypothetical protein